MVEYSVSVVFGVVPARARDIITDARLFEWHLPLGLNHVLLPPSTSVPTTNTSRSTSSHGRIVYSKLS